MPPDSSRRKRTGNRPVIQVWMDFYCPWSYCFRVRLEKLLETYATRMELRLMSFPLECVNREATPKDVLEAEWPVCALQEPRARFTNWGTDDWKWPVTMLPVFEAAHCAALQGEQEAARFDMVAREAFFSESRTICMRHVLLELAGEADLHVGRFRQDLDSGEQKKRVFADYNAGRKAGVKGTPTMVLPDGRTLANYTLTPPRLTPDHKIARVLPAEFTSESADEAMRDLMESVLRRQ